MEVRIDTLHDAFRTVFMLRAVEELSVEEVAAAWFRARSHRGHYKAHAALLSKTVAKLGDKPVLAKANYNFPADQLKSQADVLRFAAKLEQGAVSAYSGAVPWSDLR